MWGVKVTAEGGKGPAEVDNQRACSCSRLSESVLVAQFHFNSVINVSHVFY